MNFVITQNKELDANAVKQFYENGNPLIFEFWPNIKKAEDIPAAVRSDYGEKFSRRFAEINGQKEKLNEIAKAISLVINEDWSPIEDITIYVGACPIAPRDLEKKSFILPYYFEIPVLINICAHEMIHFLYFKKWSKLFPEHGPQNYEIPDPVWTLSEILLPVIGNDPKISKVVGSEFNLYPNWQNIKINDKKITDTFNEIYKQSESFDTFLKKSWQRYQELDKEFRVSETLLSTN